MLYSSHEYLTEVTVYGDSENNEIAPELVDDFDGNGDLIFAGAGDDLVDTSGAFSGGNRIDGGVGDDEVIVGLGDRAFGDKGDDLLDYKTRSTVILSRTCVGNICIQSVTEIKEWGW